MFIWSFPDVKSPEEIAFKGKMEELITGDEINLDDLSAIEFVMDDKDEEDDENMLEILEDLDFLGNKTKKRCAKAEPERGTKKRKLNEEKAKDKERDEGKEIDKDEWDEIDKVAEKEKAKEDKEKRKKIVKEIREMDGVERKAIGAFYMSLKEMQKAVKINLRALTWLQELVKHYPALDFMYKIMKPISEIMPDNPINSVVPILQLAGMRATTGRQKYKTDNIVKVVPKWVIVDGWIKHICSACIFSVVQFKAWINTQWNITCFAHVRCQFTRQFVITAALCSHLFLTKITCSTHFTATFCWQFAYVWGKMPSLQTICSISWRRSGPGDC